MGKKAEQHEYRRQQLLQMIECNPFAAKMFVFMGYASYNAAKISQKVNDLLLQHAIIRHSVPLIQKGQQLGEIKEGNAQALSIVLWCSIQGIAEEIAMNPNSPLPQADWIMDILHSKED